MEKSECNDKRKMKWQKRVVCSAKSIKRQTINLQHRLGKTEVNYVAIQDSCTVVLCTVRVLLSQVNFDIQFYFFLRTNVVLDTRGYVHFAGMYQEISSSAHAAAGGWQKRSPFIDYLE